MAQQANRMVFSATKLPMLGKKGIIEPDADGYYELVVGGLNTHNNTGAWYYVLEGVRQLFGPGTILGRRIQNGCLRAEVNHPRQAPDETDEDFFARQLDTDLNNVCGHFKEVWLDENFGRDHPEYKNPGLVAIMGKVKPSGLKGHVLKEALENKCENVCFSIRSLADEGYVRGKRLRILKELVAIDFVNEGGILVASKWDSPATESINESDAIEITRRMIERLTESGQMAMATESSREVISYIAERHFKETKPPVYTKW